MTYNLLNILYGIAAADAIGVHWKNSERSDFTRSGLLKRQISEDEIIRPVKRRNNIPLGTWSGSTSMILLTMDGIIMALADNNVIKASFYAGENLIEWYRENKYTCDGYRIETEPELKGVIENLEFGNFNNSLNISECSALRRMLPVTLLDFEFNKRESVDLYELVTKFAGLTNKGTSDVCYFYVRLLELNLQYRPVTKNDKKAIYQKVISDTPLLDEAFLDSKYQTLVSDGSALNTLKVAVWCWYNDKDYQDSILKVIRLGGCTDVAAAVTAGLVCISFDTPFEYSEQIRNKDQILYLYNNWLKYFESAR